MLPKQYHDAIEHWQRHNFPDYPKLAEEWDRFFPKDEPFCLCAKIAEDLPPQIEVGGRKGEPKALAPKDLPEEAAQHLLMQIKAQASTEFGSIQQHQGTLARAQEPQDHAWALRVMAEELRHGYQMVHLLTSADWSPVTNTKAADMVEEILSMQTGSHVLAAFNLEYDSFLDNVVFAAFIDRVGKYQLTMPKVNAYQPMAASMPPMLKVEPFHLATGVIPMRRWAELAASPGALIDVPALQKAVNKWFGRGLEMFGDERGGDTAAQLPPVDRRIPRCRSNAAGRDGDLQVRRENGDVGRGGFRQRAAGDVETVRHSCKSGLDEQRRRALRSLPRAATDYEPRRLAEGRFDHREEGRVGREPAGP